MNETYKPLSHAAFCRFHEHYAHLHDAVFSKFEWDAETKILTLNFEDLCIFDEDVGLWKTTDTSVLLTLYDVEMDEFWGEFIGYDIPKFKTDFVSTFQAVTYAGVVIGRFSTLIATATFRTEKPLHLD